MKKLLCLLLVTCLCLLPTGCGSNATEDETASTTTTPTAPKANPDLKAEDCFTLTEHDDGTYSYSVEWRGGGQLHGEAKRSHPVSCEVLSEDVVLVEGQEGTGVGARWAIFCDIQRGRVSDAYAGYLAALGNRVAFVDYRTEQYHVFVCDAFNGAEILEAYTLENLQVQEGGDMVEEFVLSKDGKLTVTYPTESGSKTITVSLA